MWLDPASLRRWMCPGDSVVAHVELQPVVGGSFRIDTRVKDGRVFVHTGQYLEIQRPERLVFTWNSTVLGDRSSQVTVEFYEQAENCLMVLIHELPADDELYEDHRKGWATILDLFMQHLKSSER